MRGRPPIPDQSPPHRLNGRIILSHSEVRVLRLLRQGKSIRAIERDTGFARSTVYAYLRNLREKFEAHTCHELVAKGATWDDSWFDISMRGAQ